MGVWAVEVSSIFTHMGILPTNPGMPAILVWFRNRCPVTKPQSPEVLRAVPCPCPHRLRTSAATVDSDPQHAAGSGVQGFNALNPAHAHTCCALVQPLWTLTFDKQQALVCRDLLP